LYCEVRTSCAKWQKKKAASLRISTLGVLLDAPIPQHVECPDSVYAFEYLEIIAFDYEIKATEMCATSICGNSATFQTSIASEVQLAV